MHVGSAPARLKCSNVLAVGAGPLLNWKAPPPGRATQIQLAGVTCRTSGPLIRCWPEAGLDRRNALAIEADDCVFEMRGSTPALLEFVGGPRRADWHECFQIVAAGALLAPGTHVATWVDLERRTTLPLNSADAAARMSVEGLVLTPLLFPGPADGRPQHSQLTEYEGPQRSGTVPGIAARSLPQVD